jgi:presenilin-like A22 family membrane protease
MYAGLAVLIAPILSLGWAIALLIIISVYDMYAVWRSKHMVVMAQAQAKNNMFAGLYLPKAAEKVRRKTPSDSARTTAHGARIAVPPSPVGSAAILGGGDIAFPLLFSCVTMDWLIMNGTGQVDALYATTIITATVTVALVLLLFFARKDRFYPAMPFLAAGCLVGLGIILLL